MGCEMDAHELVTQPLFVVRDELPSELRFDPTSWPYLVARARGTVTLVEVRLLLARLDPWLVTATSLLALWIDASAAPCPWIDEQAAHAVVCWLDQHCAELGDRRISVAFVSRHNWKRQQLEQRLCGLETQHGIALDVFAHESAARGWLRAHAVAGSAGAARRGAQRW